MNESDLREGSFVRLRTFGLLTFPLVLPILFTVFYVPNRHEDTLAAVDKRKAEVLAGIFAANAAAKVVFEDNKGLNDLLATASKDPDLVYGEILGTEGKVLSAEGNSTRAARHPVGLRELRIWEEEGVLHAAAPILQGNTVIG